MSYRQVFFGRGPSADVGSILARCSSLAREIRHSLRTPKLYVRMLGDEAAREVGVRWWMLGVPASHGGNYTRDTVAELLDDEDVACIVHDDSRGIYQFRRPGCWLTSRGLLLRGDRDVLEVEHPQAGLSNAELARIERSLDAPENARFRDAPNAVVLGIRQFFPGARTEPTSYLRLLSSGDTYLLFDGGRVLPQPERLSTPVELTNFVDANVPASDLPSEKDVFQTRAQKEAEREMAERRLQWMDEARELFREKDDAGVRERVSRILAEAPRYQPAWELAGALHAEMGRIDEADEALRMAARIVVEDWSPSRSQIETYALGPVHRLIDLLEDHGRSTDAKEVARWALGFAKWDARLAALAK